jgi:hypothetical protein
MTILKLKDNKLHLKSSENHVPVKCQLRMIVLKFKQNKLHTEGLENYVPVKCQPESGKSKVVLMLN